MQEKFRSPTGGFGAKATRLVAYKYERTQFSRREQTRTGEKQEFILASRWSRRIPRHKPQQETHKTQHRTTSKPSHNHHISNKMFLKSPREEVIFSQFSHYSKNASPAFSSATSSTTSMVTRRPKFTRQEQPSPFNSFHTPKKQDRPERCEFSSFRIQNFSITTPPGVRKQKLDLKFWRKGLPMTPPL